MMIMMEIMGIMMIIDDDAGENDNVIYGCDADDYDEADNDVDADDDDDDDNDDDGTVMTVLMIIMIYDEVDHYCG